MRNSIWINLAVVILMLFYGTALFYAGHNLLFPSAFWNWLSSFGYILMLEPAIVIVYALAMIGVKGNYGSVVFFLYSFAILMITWFLFRRKMWARNVILIQQILRMVSMLVMGYFLFTDSFRDTKNLITFLGIYFLPSLIIVFILFKNGKKGTGSGRAGLTNKNGTGYRGDSLNK